MKTCPKTQISGRGPALPQVGTPNHNGWVPRFVSWAENFLEQFTLIRAQEYKF